MSILEIKKFRISLYCIILSVFTMLIIFSLLLTDGYKYNNIDSVVQVATKISTPLPNLVKAFTGGAIHALQDDNTNKAMRIIGTNIVVFSDF